ncbi:MAG TPA: DUF1080 domain-containing protein [Planctomycetota bacterium]|nr:DUF1080 domain-containing protein [Planctomycetota bacterium]
MNRLVVLTLVALSGCAGGAASTPGEGWIDLFPSRDLKGWKRYPLDLTQPLAAKAVYRVSDDGTLLIVDAVGGIKEVLINDEERGDGIFHLEWRWGKDQGEKPNMNGGIYLRSAANGTTWIQAQVAHAQPKGPVVGDFIGMMMVDGKPQRTDKMQTGPSREAPVGDWNTYDIACRGKRISLSVNGGETVVWEDFPILRGHLGIQAEFGNYEFRVIKWKPLP